MTTDNQSPYEGTAETAPIMTARALPVLSSSNPVKVWELSYGGSVVALVSCNADDARFMSGENTRTHKMNWQPYSSGEITSFVSGFAPALALVVDGQEEAYVVPRITSSGDVVFTLHNDECDIDGDDGLSCRDYAGTFGTMAEAKAYAQREAIRSRSRETMLDAYGVNWRGLLGD